jgi:phosphoglycolate phosphatase-like HAD superfamily hydrolase
MTRDNLSTFDRFERRRYEENTTMNRILMRRRAVLAGLLTSTAIAAMPLSARLALAQSDPLPSWNDGANKQSIVSFVAAVTKEGSPDFVPAQQRVATFDNDGTLWCEQPMYVQLAFALERVKALSNQHPEWKEKQPFKAVLDNDITALAASGEKGLLELVMATHAGMTTEQFATIASDWIKTARHPRFKRPYTDLVYQPMLELLAFLRANGFQTFIVSGGGIEFMRPWTERIYGIPPAQVVGSSIKTEFKMKDGHPELFRLPAIDFIDDGPGKPVGINAHIGQRPIAAFGNSDGDLQMLQWATLSGGRRLGLIVHHTDAAREYAYDRKSHFGKLDKGLDAAKANGWTVASMKDDWNKIFKFQ